MDSSQGIPAPGPQPWVCTADARLFSASWEGALWIHHTYGYLADQTPVLSVSKPSSKTSVLTPRHDAVKAGTKVWEGFLSQHPCTGCARPSLTGGSPLRHSALCGNAPCGVGGG
jgi:hypothetical protein